MSDDEKYAGAAAIGLALLWWAFRSKVVAASALLPGVSTTLGAAPAQPPSPAAALAPATVTVISKPYQPPALDVAGDVSDGEADILTQNAGAMTALDVDATTSKLLYRQLWLPASKIPLSNLGPEDWIYAATFMQNQGGEFTRRDDLGQLGKEALADAGQQGGGALAASIIGTVASIIPIVGAGFNAAMQSISGNVATSGAWNEAMGNGQLGATIKTSLSQPTAQTRHLLANYDDPRNIIDKEYDGPEAPLDRRVMGMPQEIGFMPAQQVRPASPIFTVATSWGNLGKRQFRMRLRLWTRFAGGWVLPWLSWHFNNGDNARNSWERLGMRSTVNRRARIFRAVDAMICQYNPFTRENAPFGYWADQSANAHFSPDRAPRFPGGAAIVDDKTVFFYYNPLLGPMLGSIFPPTREDSRYVGSDGRQYSYYGEPRGKMLSTLAVGAMDDYLVDPSNAGEVRRAVSQM